jgi:hypothetical protein
MNNNTLTTLLGIGFMGYICFFKPDDNLPYLKKDGTVINAPQIEVPPADEWLGAKERNAAAAAAQNKCQFFCETVLIKQYRLNGYPKGYAVVRDSIRNAHHVGKVVVMDCK